VAARCSKLSGSKYRGCYESEKIGSSVARGSSSDFESHNIVSDLDHTLPVLRRRFGKRYFYTTYHTHEFDRG